MTPEETQAHKEADIYEKLRRVQAKISVPKGQKNAHMGYKYRNAEDILAAATPLLTEEGLTMVVADAIDVFEGRVYVVAKVYLNGLMIGQSMAREALDKKGMDVAQITGAASSYARKYALNGVFLLDDTKDADSMDNSQEGKKQATKKAVKGTIPDITQPIAHADESLAF